MQVQLLSKVWLVYQQVDRFISLIVYQLSLFRCAEWNAITCCWCAWF